MYWCQKWIFELFIHDTIFIEQFLFLFDCRCFSLSLLLYIYQFIRKIHAIILKIIAKSQYDRPISDNNMMMITIINRNAKIAVTFRDIFSCRHFNGIPIQLKCKKQNKASQSGYEMKSPLTDWNAINGFIVEIKRLR